MGRAIENILANGKLGRLASDTLKTSSIRSYNKKDVRIFTELQLLFGRTPAIEKSFQTKGKITNEHNIFRGQSENIVT